MFKNNKNLDQAIWNYTNYFPYFGQGRDCNRIIIAFIVMEQLQIFKNLIEWELFQMKTGEIIQQETFALKYIDLKFQIAF